MSSVSESPPDNSIINSPDVIPRVDISKIIQYFAIYFVITFINCFLCMYINHRIKYGSILFILLEIILVVFLISKIQKDISKLEIAKSYLLGVFGFLFVLFMFMLPAITAMFVSFKTLDKGKFNYYNIIIGLICTIMVPSIVLAMVISQLKIKN